MQKGSLRPIKDRRGIKVWRAQWRESGRGRTRILGRVSEMTRHEARAELDRILQPIQGMQMSRPSSGASLAQYVRDEYLTTRGRTWKASTTSTTEQIIETHILAEFGDRAIASLTRRELQALLDARADAGLSESVVKHIRWQLVAIFRMAAGDGLITVNPTEGLVNPRCKAQAPKVVITVDQIVKAQMVLDIRERLIVRLAVCEGMRPGEIVGLQVGDIRGDKLAISRRIYRGTVDTPKSRRSQRSVPMTRVTEALMVTYLELLRDRGAEAWLFPSEADSTPLSYSNVFRRRIQPALAKVGLAHVNFQVLRRSWVTEMKDAEDDPLVRASIAGHSVDVSENEYRQAKPEATRRAMDKLGERLQ